MIVADAECEPATEYLFPCGCWLGVVEILTGELAGKWRVVLRSCDDECERAERLGETMADA